MKLYHAIGTLWTAISCASLSCRAVPVYKHFFFNVTYEIRVRDRCRSTLEMCVCIRGIHCCPDFCIGSNVTTSIDPTSYPQNFESPTCQGSGSPPLPSTTFYRLFPYFSFCLKLNEKSHCVREATIIHRKKVKYSVLHKQLSFIQVYPKIF